MLFNNRGTILRAATFPVFAGRAARRQMAWACPATLPPGHTRFILLIAGFSRPSVIRT